MYQLYMQEFHLIEFLFNKYIPLERPVETKKGIYGFTCLVLLIQNSMSPWAILAPHQFWGFFPYHRKDCLINTVR